MKQSDVCFGRSKSICNRVSLYSVLDVAKCFTLLQYGVMGKDYCQIQCNACICVWKTSWGGWASSIIKVLHIHVVHFGTILIDCMNWLSSMQENCQTKLQVFHGRLELVSTWCECGDVWQWMVDIQSCIYGYYLMFGLYPQSMKYFTALNEPHEEA